MCFLYGWHVNGNFAVYSTNIFLEQTFRRRGMRFESSRWQFLNSNFCRLFEITGNKINVIRAVVVAQLVEWSLPIPEVRGLNPVIGKIYWPFVYCQLYWKDENTEKEAGNGPFLKIKWMLDCLQLGKFNFSFCTCFYVKTDPTYVLMQVVYRLSRKWFQPLTHVYTCLLGITK